MKLDIRDCPVSRRRSQLDSLVLDGIATQQEIYQLRFALYERMIGTEEFDDRVAYLEERREVDEIVDVLTDALQLLGVDTSDITSDSFTMVVKGKNYQVDVSKT